MTEERSRGHPGKRITRRTTTSTSSPSREGFSATVCWLLAATVYLVAEAVTASAFPGYSYVHNYISDLGVPNAGTLQGRPIDSPLHLVITFGFIAQGFLFAAGAVCVRNVVTRPLRGAFVMLSLVHALGMTMIAAVHGGQQNIDLGLGSVHLLGALLAFFAGNLAVVVAGVSLTRARNHLLGGPILIAVGSIGVIGIIMLEIDVRVLSMTVLPDAVWERIGFYAILAGEVLFGALLLRTSRDPSTHNGIPARIP